MGALTEQANSRYDLTREEQDEFAAASHQKAARGGRRTASSTRRSPRSSSRSARATRSSSARTRASGADTTAESLSKLKPAFAKDGTITAGIGVADLRRRLRRRRHERGEGRRAGLTPLAEIGAHGVVAGPDATLQSQPSRAIAEGVRARGHRPQGPRPGRAQRGLRRGRHRLHPRARHRPGEGQPQRRRHRAGPPGRHERRPHRARTWRSSCAAAAAASVPPPCAAAVARATPWSCTCPLVDRHRRRAPPSRRRPPPPPAGGGAGGRPTSRRWSRAPATVTRARSPG